MKFLDKLRSWAPWILAVIALAFMVRNEFRHRAALKSALAQVQALHSAQAKAADLQGEADVNAAQDEIRVQVEHESRSTSLSDFLRDALDGTRTGGD